MTLPDMADTLRLADQNMWEGYRQLVARAPGGEMLDDDGVLCVAGRSPSAIIVNSAFRTDRSIPAEVAPERIDAYYAARANGYCVSLQSSPEGLGVYERIGFRVVSGYRLYMRPAPAS